MTYFSLDPPNPLFFYFWTIFVITSTISGLASVITSPTSVLLDIALSTRLIIFPERVFGMSGTIQTFLGFAIGPISEVIAFDIFFQVQRLV